MNCTSCGKYAGAEKWRKLCGKCFGARKRIEEEELRKERDFYMQLAGELRSELNAKHLAQPPALTADRVRQLLQLCHPDKHNNSKTANEITQWLLSIRKAR